MIDRLIHKERFEWKGEDSILEVYEGECYDHISPVTHVRGICFTQDNSIVLSECYDGTLHLQGGRIEKDEDITQALVRELYEEASVQVTDYQVVGYIKIYPHTNPDNYHYHVVFTTSVIVLDEPIIDPDQIFINREIVPLPNIMDKLSWGKKGEVFIDLARRKLKI